MVSAVPKPGGGGDGLHAVVGVLQQPAGRLDAHALDVAGRGHAYLRREAASEVALAHDGGAGEGGHAAVLARVVGDESLCLAQPISLGHLGDEGGAELRLVGRPAQEQHQATSDG